LNQLLGRSELSFEALTSPALVYEPDQGVPDLLILRNSVRANPLPHSISPCGNALFEAEFILFKVSIGSASPFLHLDQRSTSPPSFFAVSPPFFSC